MINKINLFIHLIIEGSKAWGSQVLEVHLGHLYNLWFYIKPQMTAVQVAKLIHLLLSYVKHCLCLLIFWFPCCCLSSLGPGGSLVYSYGDDDLNRTEGADEKESGDEDSRESNSVSISLQKSLRNRIIFKFAATSEKVCCLRKLQPENGFRYIHTYFLTQFLSSFQPNGGCILSFSLTMAVSFLS